MKTKLALFGFIFSTFCAFSQEYDITVASHNLPFDSLHLQSFNGQEGFTTFYSIKYGNLVAFRGIPTLKPGLYQISGKNTPIATFFISDRINQKIGIVVGDRGVTYQNSEENNINNQYITKMNEFDGKLQLLSTRIRENSKQDISEQEKSRIFDSLLIELKKIEHEKYLYQQKTAQSAGKTLFASAVKASFSVPIPVELYYQDKKAPVHYQLSHLFDHYPFEDERLLNTPLPIAKFRSFGSLLCKADTTVADTVLATVLNKAKSSPASYFLLFENLEVILGDLYSPCWNEHLYELMLKNALQYEKLDEAKSLRYKSTLYRINKNRKGEQIPEFTLKLQDGSTQNIYDIEGEQLLLYFHNPDCENCVYVREMMKNMEELNEAIAHKKITVVTVYFEKDEDAWQKYLSEANPIYINGWDYLNEIETKDLIDLRIIPFMLIVDKDKKILRKDIRIQELQEYLKSL